MIFYAALEMREKQEQRKYENKSPRTRRKKQYFKTISSKQNIFIGNIISQMKEYIGDFFFYSRSQYLPEENSLGLPVDIAQQLSNFSFCKKPIELTDPDFARPIPLPTIEHAYQLAKCLLMCRNREQKQTMIDIFTNPSLEASEAKNIGNKDSFERFDLIFNEDLWRAHSRSIMKDLVYQKINKHHQIKNALKVLHQKKLRLVHYSPRDKIWGACPIHFEGHIVGEYSRSQPLNGDNELGKIYHKYMEDHFHA